MNNVVSIPGMFSKHTPLQLRQVFAKELAGEIDTICVPERLNQFLICSMFGFPMLFFALIVAKTTGVIYDDSFFLLSLFTSIVFFQMNLALAALLNALTISRATLRVKARCAPLMKRLKETRKGLWMDLEASEEAERKWVAPKKVA